MFFKSRLAVAAVLMTVLFGVLLWRVFYLQIVKGEEYQDNYTLKIVKERTLNSTRGNIYDRNGELLAYNELAYSITIEDNGSYSSTDKKNESLNAEIAQVITALEKNGDAITDDFKIDRTGEGTYEFNVTGTSLKRFLADVYGESSYDDLGMNKSLATTPPRRPWIRLWTISATTVTASTTATATRWRSRSRSCVLPWRRMPTRNISQPRLRPTYPKNPWRTSASTHRNCRALR